MTGFHEVRFPDSIAYGATGGPDFATTVVVTGTKEAIVAFNSAPVLPSLFASAWNGHDMAPLAELESTFGRIS